MSLQLSADSNPLPIPYPSVQPSCVYCENCGKADFATVTCIKHWQYKHHEEALNCNDYKTPNSKSTDC